jgi:hypothetical protein
VTGGGEPRFGGPASGALPGVRPVAAPPAGTRARRGWGSPHDDHDQRGPGDDEPSYELDGDRRQPRTREERLGPGAAVRHAVFGDGIVAEAQGEGRDRRLVVRFAGAGAKTVLARFVEATGDDAGRDDG